MKNLAPIRPLVPLSRRRVMRIMKKLLVTTAALAVLTTHASATVALE